MSSLTQDLTRAIRQGFAWWTGELTSLFPKSVRNDRPAVEAGTVINLHQGRLSLAADARGTVIASPGEALSEQAVLEYVARRSRPGLPHGVRLRLPYAACLARFIEVPQSARDDVESILALDLERATPLNAADVYTARYRDPVRSSKGTIGFVQLIAKKSAIDSAIARLEGMGARVEAVDCWGEDGKAALPVNFLNRTVNGQVPGEAQRRRRVKMLLGLSALLAMSAVWLSIARHQSALDSLEQLTDTARSRVAALESRHSGAETAAKEVQAVMALRAAHPMTVHILDELTRLLPDSAYLTDFSLDGDTVEITGFAQRAAGLVPILERSQMFSEAGLSAPVTLDSTQDKERFSYRLRLRQAAHSVAPENETASPIEATP